MYPADPEVALERVWQCIEQFGVDPNNVIQGLLDRGIPPVDAELLRLYVPTAFAWAFLRQFEVTYPTVFVVRTEAGGTTELPVDTEGYFTTALGLGYEVMEKGFLKELPRPLFENILNRSAELNAVKRAIQAGDEIRGGALKPPILYGLTAEEILAGRSAELS